jgi:hypothetical protein
VAAQTPAGDDGQMLLQRDSTLVQHRGSAFPGTLVITEARILHRQKTVLPWRLLRTLTLGRISATPTITEVMLADITTLQHGHYGRVPTLDITLPTDSYRIFLSDEDDYQAVAGLLRKALGTWAARGAHAAAPDQSSAQSDSTSGRAVFIRE